MQFGGIALLEFRILRKCGYAISRLTRLENRTF